MSSGPAFAPSIQQSGASAPGSLQQSQQAELQTKELRSGHLPEVDRGVEFRTEDRLDPALVAERLKNGIDQATENALKMIDAEMQQAAIPGGKVEITRQVMSSGARLESVKNAINSASIEPMSLTDQDRLMASLETLLSAGDVTKSEEQLSKGADDEAQKADLGEGSFKFLIAYPRAKAA